MREPERALVQTSDTRAAPGRCGSVRSSANHRIETPRRCRLRPGLALAHPAV